MAPGASWTNKQGDETINLGKVSELDRTRLFRVTTFKYKESDTIRVVLYL